MALTIDDLVSAQTEDQVRATLYSILTSLGFSPTSWRPGGVARTLVAVLAVVLAAFTTTIVNIAKSGFLDFATGAWLTLLAKQFFDVDRAEASFASGFVTLTNSGGGVYPFAARACTFVNSTTGKTYKNVDAFTLAALSSATVAVEAVEAGSDSTATPAQIDALQTVLIGVTVTNASALIGDDEETDENVRIRCRDKFAALSPMGPRAVYDYVSRTQSLNGGVTVTRTKVYGDTATGVVTIYIADDSGAVSSGTVTSVQTGIDTYAVPQCVTGEVYSAVNNAIAVELDVWIYTSESMTDAEVQSAISAALVSYFKKAPISGVKIPPDSGKLFVKSLEEVAAAAVPAIKVSVTTPAADVAIAVGEVPVLSGAATINVHQVSE